MFKNRKLLLSMLGASFLYALLHLISLPHLSQLAGQPLPNPLFGGYGREGLLELLTELGPAGRAYYLSIQLPLATLFPLFFALMTFQIFKTYLADKTYLLLLPILSFSAAYLENGVLLHSLLSFPNLSQTLLNLGNLARGVKSLAYGLIFLILVLLVVRSALSFLLSKR